MIEYCQAKRFIEAQAWPEGTRPLLAMTHEPVTRGGATAFVMRLYRPEDRFPVIVQIAGPPPEGALRIALRAWVERYELPPALVPGFVRLTN